MVGPEEIVGGTPLVSIVDGLYAHTYLQSLPDLVGLAGRYESIRV